MSSFKEVAERLKKLDKKVKNQANEVAKKVAMTVVGDLVYTTPVDTSEALSNWLVGINNPPFGPIGPRFPGELGSTQKLSAEETLLAAKRRLDDGKTYGKTIYISNSARHIRKLNDGGSGQTPEGFVERAVKLGRRQLKKEKLKLK